MSKSTWIYPGTFDPMTYGHRDIILRAAKLAPKLVVAVANHQSKNTWFSQAERIAMMQEALSDVDNVEVLAMDGLIVDFAQQNGATTIVRGLRSGQDWEFEQRLHGMNHAMMPDFETVFLATDPRYSHISSTIVREIAQLNGDISSFVPEAVLRVIRAK